MLLLPTGLGWRAFSNINIGAFFESVDFLAACVNRDFFLLNIVLLLLNNLVSLLQLVLLRLQRVVHCANSCLQFLLVLLCKF